jgi:hypothetical protein
MSNLWRTIKLNDINISANIRNKALEFHKYINEAVKSPYPKIRDSVLCLLKAWYINMTFKSIPSHSIPEN